VDPVAINLRRVTGRLLAEFKTPAEKGDRLLFVIDEDTPR
jgi:hypothetical protein